LQNYFAHFFSECAFFFDNIEKNAPVKDDFSLLNAFLEKKIKKNFVFDDNISK